MGRLEKVFGSKFVYGGSPYHNASPDVVRPMLEEYIERLRERYDRLLETYRVIGLLGDKTPPELDVVLRRTGVNNLLYGMDYKLDRPALCVPGISLDALLRSMNEIYKEREIHLTSKLQSYTPQKWSLQFLESLDDSDENRDDSLEEYELSDHYLSDDDQFLMRALEPNSDGGNLRVLLAKRNLSEFARVDGLSFAYSLLNGLPNGSGARLFDGEGFGFEQGLSSVEYSREIISFGYRDYVDQEFIRAVGEHALNPRAELKPRRVPCKGGVWGFE